MANVTATGLPAVLECRIFQKSNADAGVCVLHTQYADTDNEVVPTSTTITITSTGFSGTWPDMKLVKAPRVMGDSLVWMFQDSRHSMCEGNLKSSYNLRDEVGKIFSASELTISQLWAVIASSAGIPISVGTVPSFKPTAEWTGKTPYEAATKLLHDTACHMVYDPAAQTYRISTAGTGALPTLSARTLKPGPSQEVKDLLLETAPITYEGELTANAVLQDPTGSLETLSTVVTPVDHFNGYESTADAADRVRYQQSSFRLWLVDNPEDYQFLESLATRLSNRGEKVASGPYAVTTGTFATYPGYQFYSGGNSSDQSLTPVPKSGLFVANEPLIPVSSAGSILGTIKIRAAWYDIAASGNPEVNRETKPINITGEDVSVTVDWIRPYQSTLGEANTGTDIWQTLLSEVANAQATKYGATRQMATVTNAVNAAGSGQVGSVMYHLKTGFRGEITTTWTFNWIPDNFRLLRK